VDDLPWHIGLLIVAALLLANGLFVAAEFALVTVRRTRMEMLADEGQASARRVMRALGNLDYFVAASQLGITMASIALGFVGEPVLAGLIEPPVERVVGSFAPAISHTLAIAVAFFFVTSLHIVIGEFVPKSIALQEPERTATAISGPMSLFVRVFGPAIWLLNATGNTLLRMVGVAVDPITDTPLAADDLALTMESSASAGLISRRELDLAQHALELESTDAGHVMIPRNEIAAISQDASREEVLRLMAGHRHTRYPVYEGDLDAITGILNAKHVLLDDDPDGDWRRHVQPPIILPESADVLEVIGKTEPGKNELVILVDEYGGTAGILSLFDIAEHLAGRLPEDLEAEDPAIPRLPDGSLLLSGQTRLTMLAERFAVDLEEDEVHTIAGVVMEQLGHIPVVGESVVVDGYELVVRAMDGHRIDTVHMRDIGFVTDIAPKGEPGDG
jgi:putative hemolysin